MKKKLTRWVATMIAGVMIASSVGGSVVSAADENQRHITGNQMTADGQKEVEEAQAEKETKVIENELNYIYINESELEAGNTQSIVLSWGENTSEIQNINLTVENERGSQTILSAEKRVDELFLYEHSFEKGIYHVTEVSVTTNSDTKNFTAEELEIDVYFGVDKKVDEDVKSDYIEMESQSVEDSVVTIETDNVAAARKSIADALSEQVEQTSEKRERSNSDLVIVLDPGHDASKHAGASANGVREEIVTLKIAEYCKEVLEQYSGVSVYMTRTDGNCPFPDTNSIDDILKRVEWAKTKDADVFISFHINSSVSSAAQGAEVYYPKGEKDAQDLAKDIVGELAKLGLKNRGDKGDDSYAVIRHSKRNGFPGLIIEHAFVSNVSDAKWFQTEENLKKLGEADAAGIISYYGITKGNWEFTDGYWKWKEGNGKYATSTWKSINNVWYYFDANSNMVTGWQSVGGKWYYMDRSGAMATGWQSVDGRWYYMDGSGAMTTGWQPVDGKWYYMDGSGAMTTGWQSVDGKWYYMDGSGAMTTGWQPVDGKWYYMDGSGAMLTGFQTVGDQKCYFNSSGVMQTGWQFIDNVWYFFNNSGYLLKGEQIISGEKWYLDKNTGALYTGWQLVNNKWYYHTSVGMKQTGWQQIGGIWYYMDASGVMQTGWQTVGNQTYYFNGSGAMLVGWQFIDNVWYYFNNSGYLLKGEQVIEGTKWYLDSETGALYTGWQIQSGKKYYYNSYGEKQTGWQNISGKKYYMDKDGVVQTGWKKIDEIWYYFESSGELNNNPSSQPPSNDSVASYYEIAGNSSVTVKQMVNYYKKSGKTYPTEALKAGGATTIEEFCEIYYEECKTEGIKAEVAFAQSMLETGFLQFGGNVKVEQFNFAGLGATGNGVSGNSFENVRIGIRAHIQHLKCYANAEPLKNECVDPRWGEWLRGKAPYVEWLSIPNNPNGTGWAGDANYAAKILSGIREMKKM